MRPGILHVFLLACSLSRAAFAAGGDQAPACPGLGGSNTFSDDVATYRKTYADACEPQGQSYQAVYAKASREVEICSKLATFAKSNWDKDSVQRLGDRYNAACDRLMRQVQRCSRICATYPTLAAKTPPSPTGDVNGLEAAKATGSFYRRMACDYGLLEKSAWFAQPAAFFGGKTGQNIPMTDSDFTAAAAAVAASARSASIAAQQLLNAPSSSYPADVAAKVSAAVNSCDSARTDLDQLNKAYQTKIYRAISGLYRDAISAEKFFREQKNSYTGMQRQLGQRAQALGGGSTAPILVRRNASNPADPDVETCPDDSELTAVQKSLQKNVFYAETSTGEIGSLFRAKTTGPDGKPIFHDVTASHVALVDAHDPNNQELAGVTAAPAGQIMNATEPKKFDNTPDTIDRTHDVAMAPAGYGPGLPVKADDASPRPGQEFIIAGHPVDNYSSNYVNMSCTFLGYGAEEQSGDYVLDCPTGGASIGGMSGGPMVDAKTGTVWGVSTNQGGTPDGQGDYNYTDSHVFVSPIQQGKNGEILTGPQRYDSGYCYSVYGSAPRACYVTPVGTVYP